MSHRKLDPDRLRAITYQALSQRIRGVIWLDHHTNRQTQARALWPELFEAIDELIEQVDADHPPFGSAGRSPFGGG